jgi:hypothetical protein
LHGDSWKPPKNTSKAIKSRKFIWGLSDKVCKLNQKK